MATTNLTELTASVTNQAVKQSVSITYVYWCSTRFPYQMMCASFNINMTVVTWGTGTISPSGTIEFSPVFIGVLIASSLD
jgi:hypothetical protein